jgi:5-methylthioadenosine/S-adenosylhomocysteine deaminase
MNNFIFFIKNFYYSFFPFFLPVSSVFVPCVMGIEVDLVVSAGWVIPVCPPNTVFQDHSIVIHKEKIIDILRTDDALNKYSPQSTYNGGKDTVIIPGLINAHTHSPMTLLRNFAHDVPLMSWLSDYIWPAEAAFVSPEFCRVGTKMAIAEMIMSGITCFNDMYFYAEDTASVVLEVGSRACIGIPVVVFPTNYAKSAEEYFEKGLINKQKLEDKNHLFFLLAPHAPYTVDDNSLSKVKELSQKENMKVHIHVHETAQEITDSLRDYGVRPLERLQNLGLLNEKLICVHMTQLTPHEISLLKTAKASIIHCPESNMKLGSGFCDVKTLFDEGILVGLGTDGAASNDDLDILGEIRTASLLSSYLSQSQGKNPIPSHHLLEMATINNAQILGIDHLVGSLQVGKAADLVAIRLIDPVYNPIKHVTQIGTNRVTDVWIAGKRMLENQKLICLDEKQLKDEVKEWEERISKTITGCHTVI